MLINSILFASSLTLWAESVGALHECDSLLTHDAFRCRGDKRLCLPNNEYICREPLLSPGLVDQCPDQSNQWRGLCTRMCYGGFGLRRGFRCGDNYCVTNLMKWCDGKVDCPNDDADEAHCNCTARPSDCVHWASEDRRALVSSQYLFRRVFAPMGFFVIILVLWKYYRTMKLRQRLASLHLNPDVRLCDADVVYVGGVTELARRGRRGNTGSADGYNAANAALGIGGLGPPPYSSTVVGPPPYESEPGNDAERQPAAPPSYQDSVDSRPRLAGPGNCDDSNLRVDLPPLSPPPLQLNDANLPPPPPYETVAKKQDKD